MLEWLLAILSISGAMLNSTPNRRLVNLSFWLWSITNIGWIYSNAAAGLWPAAMMFGVYLLTSLNGIKSTTIKRSHKK